LAKIGLRAKTRGLATVFRDRWMVGWTLVDVMTVSGLIDRAQFKVDRPHTSVLFVSRLLLSSSAH